MNAAEHALLTHAPDVFDRPASPATTPVLVKGAAIDRARAYLAAMGPAIEGQGGDLHTFKAACALVVDFALSDADASMLLTEWNATCVPPWTHAELDNKIRSANKSGTHAVGAKLESPSRVNVRHAQHEQADDHERAAFAERFPAFLQRTRKQVLPADYVTGLVPGVGITMVHGQPRDMKTWARQEITRATSTGDAAFGMFPVPTPLVTWVITDEDHEIIERDRYVAFYAGRNQAPSDNLIVSVQKGINLDDATWQANVEAFIIREQVKLFTVDPVRASTAMADQGPRELKPFAMFLRRLMRNTGCAVLLVHHDTKPLVGKQDDRAKPQRASGGGIFSIADAPIHAERIGTTGAQTLLTPSLYKFSVAPEPFLVTLEANDPKRPTLVRMVGESSTAKEASQLALHQKITDYLRDNPGASGSAVAKAVHGRKDHVLDALETMERRGGVTFIQRGQAKLWAALAAEVAQ